MAKLYNVIMFVTMAISVGVFGYVAQMASIGLAAGLLLLSMLFKMKRIKAINQQYDQYARQITLGASAGDGYRIYTNPSYNFIVKSTDRWNQVSNVGPFDLKLYNATSDLYFYVMAYKKSEIKAGNLAKRVLELQLKDFQSKRNNVKELDPVAEIKTPDKTMYQTMFSAEKDGSVNHYYTRGIELLQGDEVLWVMANGQPDSIRNNLGEIKTMMDGITYKK